MEYLIDNGAIIIATLAAIVAAAAAIVSFFKLPTDEQLKKVKEWLLYAVTMAEKELGGGTGKLKLRYVYDLFLTKFGWLAKVITFEQFSTLVDEALEDMKRLLDSNAQVQALVSSKESEGE